MIICTVVGHVWATKKEESLSGLKLMVIREEQPGRRAGKEYVAADLVGAAVDSPFGQIVALHQRDVLNSTSCPSLG